MRTNPRMRVPGGNPGIILLWLVSCSAAASVSSTAPDGAGGSSGGSVDLAGASHGGTSAAAGASEAGNGGLASVSAEGGRTGLGGGSDAAGASGGSDAAGAGGAGGAAARSKKGISAWLYKDDAALAAQLTRYDSVVQAKPAAEERRLRYLFPYAGSIGLTGTRYQKGALTYDAKAAAYYAAKIPRADLLPNIDSADGGALAKFSPADQELLAADVAGAILVDDNARGVHVDIEPFHDEHAPFYAKLKSLLHAGNKQLTLFTGLASGPIYAAADIVVLSGYDLGITPVTVAQYQSTLASLVSRALDSANAGGSSLLVGIPASASYEEYATQSGTCSASTQVTQEQWVKAALNAVCSHQSDARYLGLSLWQVTDAALSIRAEPGCLRHPDSISDTVWSLLEDFDPTHCP